MKESTAKGVVGIFIDDDGDVIAAVNDFNVSCNGGYTLREAQKLRVKKKLNSLVVHRYCSPALARAVGEYEAEKIIRNLIDEHKCKIEFVYIGHEEEE